MSGFLKNKYLRICPYGKKQLNFLVKRCLRDTIVLLVAAVVAVIVWNGLFRFESGIYLLESIILAVYLVFTEVPNYFLQEKENQVLHAFMLYLSRVKHHYMSCRHIANSIVDASEGMGHEMERLSMEMYRLLMEDNRKTKIRSYIENHNMNRYWKLFLIQAYEVSEKGDSYFSENVEHIRMELMEEIYRRKCREYAYAGYVFVTVAPFFMMPVLKYWGMEFASELSFFYTGMGRVLETLVFVATLVVYNLISEAKEITFLSGRKREHIINTDILFRTETMKGIIRQLEKKGGRIRNKVKKLLLRSGEIISYGRFSFQCLCCAAAVFLILAAFVSSGHVRERKEILSHVENMDQIAPVVSDEKRELLEKYILEITELCSQESHTEKEIVREILRKKIRLGNEFTETAVVDEIMKKIQRYKQARGTVLELMICLLGGIGAGMLPVLQLHFRAGVIRKEVESEVKQFQSVVLMERRIYGITLVGLLEDMETFSICFKGVLRRCINTYGFNAKEALMQLKRDGMSIYSGFESLADAFLSVDEVGIEDAFAEIENDQRLLEKMSRLETKVMQEKKRDTMELLTRIPMVLAVGVYFILPFFLYSLQSVSEIFTLLEEMQL